jgi:hypothetical protein
MLKSLTLPPALAWRDALQAGLSGLRRGAELFAPSRGARFSTYACLWWARARASGGPRRAGAPRPACAEFVP